MGLINKGKLGHIFDSSKRAQAALFLIAYIIYFSFGSFHIDKFIVADENLWLYVRIHQYWSSLASGNFDGTFINDKPGVSVALISGIGYNLNKKNIVDSLENFKNTDPKSVGYQSIKDKNININLLSLRLPLLIFNGLAVLLFFWLLKIITKNDWIALWSSILILLSPVLLGISQIINPDALLWTFSTASLLAFIGYLETERKSLVVICSLSLGMALLSKYTANLLFPFFPLISFAYMGYKTDEWKNLNINISKKIKKMCATCLIIFAGSWLVFSLLMPAVFFKKDLFFEETIGYPGMQYFFWPLLAVQIIVLLDAILLKSRIFIAISGIIRTLLKKYSSIIYLILTVTFLTVLICWMGKRKIIDFGDIKFDLRRDKEFAELPLLKKIIFEVFPFVFSLTPLMLFALLYLWIKSFLKKNYFNLLLFIFSLLFVIFYAAMVFQSLLVTIRYTVILYPLAAILAALGIQEFLSCKLLAKINKFFVSLLLILISVWSLWLIKPFYFNYTSDLLSKKYLIADAWGYGGYEAAEYINSLPNSQNLVVWADYAGVCEFIKGHCYVFATDHTTNSVIDYFVITRRGKLRYQKRNDSVKAYKFYTQKDPVWRLNIDDRPGNYIKIFKNDTKNESPANSE